MTGITFDRLSPTIGAEVGNIDLRETLDDATIATLRAGLLEHKVLFFREQAITSEQHSTSAGTSATSRCTRSHPRTRNTARSC